MSDTSTDVANVTFTDDDLHDITSWNDAITLLERAGLQGEDFSDYGTGFSVVEKSTLEKTPLMILEWRFNSGDYSSEFVSATAVTKDGRKVIINDGGTGICAQLRRVTDLRTQKGHKNPQAALYVANGLTRSDYKYTDEKTGQQKDATTYYFSE